MMLDLTRAQARVLRRLADDALDPPCDDLCYPEFGFTCQHIHTAFNEDAELRDFLRALDDAERT